MTKQCLLLLGFLMVSFLYAQTIEDTMKEIANTKGNLIRDEITCKNQIDSIMATNPLFAKQDKFESDKQYLSRICANAHSIIGLKDKYIKSHIETLSGLRKRLFDTRDIDVTLGNYDANSQTYDFFVQSQKYSVDTTWVNHPVAVDVARILDANWDRVEKIGLLYIDYDDVIRIGKVTIRDTETKIEFVIDIQNQWMFGSENTSKIAFSNNGKYLAFDWGDDDPGKVTVLESQKTIYEFRYPDRITAIGLSPDGRYLGICVSGVSSYKQDFWLVDLKTKEQLMSLSVEGPIIAIAFSPDGRLVAVGGGAERIDPILRIYEISTLKEIADLSDYYVVYDIVFSPDQKYLAAAGRFLEVTNLITGEKEINIAARNHFSCVAIHPYANIIAAGGEYEGLRIFNLFSKKEIANIEENKTVRSVAFKPTGEWLAASVDMLNIYSAATFNKGGAFPFGAAFYSTDANYIASRGVMHLGYVLPKNGYIPKSVQDVNATAQDSFILVSGGVYNNGYYTGYVSSFYMDKFELTNADYLTAMGSDLTGKHSGGDMFPVADVTWFNAIEYCNRRSILEGRTPCYSYAEFGTNPEAWPADWDSLSTNHLNVTCNWKAAGYRLPTEMEWMYAARGGKTSHNYAYSGSNDINAVAWYTGNNNPYGIKQVGTKAANEFGVFDMSGNLWEWIWDISDSYHSGNQINPTGATSGTLREVRGGSWGVNADYCTVSFRGGFKATDTSSSLGFRLVRISP